MKSFLLKSFAIAVVIGALFAGPAVSQEQTSPDQDSLMAIYMKYATPDEHHQALDPLAGKWELASRYYMSPESPAQESKGTSRAEWVLGGRYLRESVTGEMGSGTFNGVSLTGYDLAKRQYFNIWMDDMSTAPMISYGQMDSTGQVLTLVGTYPDVARNMQEVKYRTVYKIVSPDQHIMEMYMIGDDGSEFKNMEIVYTRVK